MVDHCIRPKFFRSKIVEPEADGDTRYACGLCCAGVIGSVADISRPAASATRDHFQQQIRRRLGPALTQCVTAHYGLEPIGQAQFLKQLAGQRFELVGDDSQRSAALSQRIEHCLAAGVQA